MTNGSNLQEMIFLLEHESLSDADWVSVTTIVDESLVRSAIPRLKDAGARGIVEYGINKIID